MTVMGSELEAVKVLVLYRYQSIVMVLYRYQSIVMVLYRYQSIVMAAR